MRVPPKLKPTIAAALLALASGGAASADRYWSFASGCSAADFTSFCWRASVNGAPGASPPVLGDSVFILQNAATELTVRAINAAGTVLPKVQSLVLDGSGAGAAGLRLERGTLQAVSAIVGQAGRGHVTQSGGLAVLDGLTLGYAGYGRYDLQGGELRTQGLAVGLGGSGDLVQTAGVLSVTGILGVSPGSTLRSDGGTLDLRGVNAFSQYANGQWGTVHLAGGTVLTNAGQTLRAGKLLATAGSGEMLRNTLLEVSDLVLSGVGRTVELDARVRNSGFTTVLASAANEQVTANLRGQGSLLGTVVVGTDANGFGAGRGVLQLLAGGQAGADALFAGNREGGVGQLRVSGVGSSLTVAGAVEIGAVNAWDQPFSLLTVDQGGRLDASTLKLNDNGFAQVMSGGRIAVGDSLILFTQSNRQPSLLVSDGGGVSAGTTLLNSGTTLGLTGPSSTLATGVLTNNGTAFLAGMDASITGAGGLGTPLTVINAGLLDVREAAVAHVAGAVQNQGGATVNIGTGASLRMGSYGGTGTLAIGNGAKAQVDGAAVVQDGGVVQVDTAASLRMGSYTGRGKLDISGGAQAQIDGAAVLNRGRLRLESGASLRLAGDALVQDLGLVLVIGGSSLRAGNVSVVEGSLVAHESSLFTDGEVHIHPGALASIDASNWRARRIVNDGWLSLSESTLLPVDPGTTSLLVNNGAMYLYRGPSQLGGYTGKGAVSFSDPSAITMVFQGRVERVAGSRFEALNGALNQRTVYGDEVVFDLRSGGITDAISTAFADSAVVTLELGPGGLEGSHAAKFDSGLALALGGRLQLDFGAGGPLGPDASAPQLHPGLTLDLFDGLSFSGSFASVTLLHATLAPGAALDLSSLSTDGIVRVVAAPVPEPGTWALWLGGLAALGWPHARRRAVRAAASRQPRTNPKP